MNDHIRIVPDPSIGDAVDIVNDAQLRRLSESYEKAHKKSTTGVRVEYKPKKKKIRTRFVALALCSVALIGSFALFSKDKQVTSHDLDETVAITIVDGNEVLDVDKTIAAFQKLMDNTGPERYRIENAYEYNANNHEANVDYNPGTLHKLIINAAEDSEIKARCAILAAYKVINEPYRQEQFDKLFGDIAGNQELASALPQIMGTGSWNSYLRSLGYESESDYNNAERQAIKNLVQARETITDLKGR